MNFLRRAYGSMGDEPDDASEARHGLSRAEAAVAKLETDIQMFEQENGRVHKEIDALAAMVGVRIKTGAPSARLRELRQEVSARSKRR